MPRIQTYLSAEESAAFYHMVAENGSTPYVEMRKAMLKHLGIVETKKKTVKEKSEDESGSTLEDNGVARTDGPGSGQSAGSGEISNGDAGLDRRLREIRRKLESGGESE